MMELNIEKVSFSSKPSPVFPSYRPMLRIGQVLLVLKINSTAGKASLLKLHLFSWGFKELQNLEYIATYADNIQNSQLQFFGIEPSLNRALSYAIYENLIGFDGAKYSLTDKGRMLADYIINDPLIFEKEKPVLRQIGKKISEAKLTLVQKLWSNA